MLTEKSVGVSGASIEAARRLTARGKDMLEPNEVVLTVTDEPKE